MSLMTMSPDGRRKGRGTNKEGYAITFATAADEMAQFKILKKTLSVMKIPFRLFVKVPPLLEATGIRRNHNINRLVP